MAPPIGLKYRSSNWFAVTTVTCAVFTDILLYGIIVPVIPFSLQQRVGIDAGNVQYWVSVLLAVYGAGLLVCSPICGWLSDRVSARRWPLLLGLIALSGATIMLHVGTSMPVLVVGRLLQGISAAVVWVVGLALLVDTVEQDRLGRYMGFVSLGMSAGLMVAPLLGGVLFERAGYNAVFSICYAFIALDVAFRLLFIERKDARKWVEEGSIVTTAQGTGIASPDDHANHDTEKVLDSNTTTQTLIPTTYGTTTTTPVKKSRLPAFVTLLASRRLLAALFACLVQATLIASFDSVLPLFVNETFDWYSLQAGILYLAIIVPTILSPLVGYFSDRYGNGGRWFTTAGFLFSTPFFVLLRLIDHNSIGQKVLLVALLALIGLGLTCCFPPLMVEISNVVAAKERAKPGAYGHGGAYAQAYGLFNMAFAGGSLVGPLWAGFIKKEAGWSTMTWTLGLLSGIAAIPTAIWVGGSIRKKRNHKRSTSPESA